jgi:hypothetical protein
MKRTLFIIYLFTILIGVKGQNYIPFPMDSTIWSVNSTKYFVHGDTTIGSNHYSKVWMQTDSVEFTFDMDKATYYAAIRNDTANKRVYGVYYKADTVYNYAEYYRFLFYSPGSISPQFYNCDTCELLLYDFNVENIDTLMIYTFPFIRYDKVWNGQASLETSSANHIMQIKLNHFDITTQNINGINRKVVNVFSHLQCSWTGRWIEGIGSLSGLFYTGHYMEFEWPGETELLCVESNKEMIYKQDTVCYRHITRTLGHVDEFQKNNDYTIYPNPVVNNEFRIKSNALNNTYSDVVFELYDIHGNILLLLSINNSQTPISINHLPIGIYLYKITNKLKQIGYGKIIKL